MASVPGDPREDAAIELVNKEDLQALVENVMLQTKLLDYVLYYMCKPCTIINGINFAMGSTLTRRMIQTLAIILQDEFN